MDQEKIGKFILELRKKNNLTQREFAKKFGVTYQAVSKWENGKNIPDISIIKQICEEYSLDINDVLLIKKEEKNKDTNKVNKIILILLFLSILVIIFLSQFNYSKNNNFKFKTIEANCDNFNISGSIAYNNDKSSIYISNVEYCGLSENVEYDKIDCSLYEVENDKMVKISSCGFEIDKPMTLNDYLENVKFNVDNHNSICKEYSDNNLMLEIDASDSNGRITTYKVPLKLSSTCKE